MMHIFFKNGKEKELLRLQEFRESSWVHVEEPTEDELKYLQEVLGLDEYLLKDATDKHEIPRIEVENDIIYFFTRYAYTREKQITTAPMMIAIGKTFIVTVTPAHFPRLEFLLNGKSGFSTTQKTKLLIKMLSQIQETFNATLHIITKNVRTYTVQLEKIRNKDIVQFVLFENDLHDFTLALVKTNNDLNNILSGKLMPVTQSDRDQIEDIMLSNGQIIDICNENIRTIVNLRDAYSIVMTNNLNRVIKLFTSLTVILTIPTIIASFFGMNVNLPPLEFFEILAATAFVCIVTFIFFTYQDWL
jgi:magnesium transporter